MLVIWNLSIVFIYKPQYTILHNSDVLHKLIGKLDQHRLNEIIIRSENTTQTFACPYSSTLACEHIDRLKA